MIAPMPAKALREGAVYFGDNGRRLCTDIPCGGASSVYTGRDLSGYPVSRVTVADVRGWPTGELGEFACECGRVVLSPLAGPDGYPLPRPAR